MIETVHTRQAQDAYTAAHKARAEAFSAFLARLFGTKSRSADPKGSYGAVPLT